MEKGWGSERVIYGVGIILGGRFIYYVIIT